MRQRYQQGSVIRRSRKGGDVWVYTYRENVNGKRVRREHIIGTVTQYKNETAAWRAVDLIRVNLNAQQSGIGPAMTFKALAEHYDLQELQGGSKAWSTVETNRGYLRKWIVPMWGRNSISELTPVIVENWLKGLKELAPGSRAKIRNLMSAIYRHALRHGFVMSNPITLVRQGSKREKAPVLLTVEELKSLLAAVRPRERTMILMDAGLGLRRGELCGTQWGDVDFKEMQIHIRRSVVAGHVGLTKTEASQKLMPLDEYMARDLLDWYKATPYKQPGDYVFATTSNRAGKKRGLQPVSLAKVMTYWNQPAAKKIGITKRVGWHTFRHTFKNLLRENEKDIKTVQELLRHSSSRVTLDIYSQAVTEDKRKAQSKVVRRLVQ